MFNKILVPLDGSKLAEYVLPFVQIIANGCDLPVVVFTRVIEPISPAVSSEYFSADVYSQIESEVKNYLMQIASTVRFDNATVETKILYGRAADNLIDYTKNNKVDLIIIATHGRSGLSRWIRGSVANRILQSTHTPVLMIPPRNRTRKLEKSHTFWP